MELGWCRVQQLPHVGHIVKATQALPEGLDAGLTVGFAGEEATQLSDPAYGLA